MSRVLVSGGAGYIGSHAVRKLLESGHEVVVVDNLSHGFKEAVDSRAVFQQASVQDSETIKSLIERHQIDSVLHFAAYIEVGESVSDPFKYYENNFSHAINFIRSCVRAGVRRFVFSSTAAVYGQPEYTPIDEE